MLNSTMEIDFEARDQFKPYIFRDQRWACIVAHRRAGKTVACIMDLLIWAMACKKREPRFAYVAPTYTQAKDVAWSYLKEYTQSIPGIQKSESELTVTLPHNGARIRLYGAENYDRLRGLYLDGAIIDEAGDIDPRAWGEVIRPALSDRQGWATFIGTPKGHNEFLKIYKRSKQEDDWYSEELKASKTGILAEGELADARKTMTFEQYEQEYECSFEAAIIGAYYGKEMRQAEDRITKVPHDRATDVYACWDLGIGDSTAIWTFQIVGSEWHWLHYYESSGEALDHYVNILKDYPYRIDTHYLPHDAEARELQTGNSRVEFLEKRGFDCVVVPRHNVDDGISAVRLKFNRFWFDEEGCGLGLDALRMYRTEYDDKRQTLRKAPLHDWSSHGADALRYGVMGAEERQTTDYQDQPDDEWVV